MKLIRGLIAVSFLLVFAFLIFINGYVAYKNVQRSPLLSEITDEEAIAAKKAREEAERAEAEAKRKAEEEAKRKAREEAEAKAALALEKELEEIRKTCVNEIIEGQEYILVTDKGDLHYRREKGLNFFLLEDGYARYASLGDYFRMQDLERGKSAMQMFKQMENYQELKPNSINEFEYVNYIFSKAKNQYLSSSRKKRKVVIETKGTEKFRFGKKEACEVELIEGKIIKGVGIHKDYHFFYSPKHKIVFKGERDVQGRATVKDIKLINTDQSKGEQPLADNKHQVAANSQDAKACDLDFPLNDGEVYKRVLFQNGYEIPEYIKFNGDFIITSTKADFSTFGKSKYNIFGVEFFKDGKTISRTEFSPEVKLSDLSADFRDYKRTVRYFDGKNDKTFNIKLKKGDLTTRNYLNCDIDIIPVYYNDDWVSYYSPKYKMTFERIFKGKTDKKILSVDKI